jgi:hypothetical protein
MPAAQLTLQDILQLFQESDRRFQQSEHRFQEMERVIKEQRLETEHRFQEMERVIKEQSLETDRRLKETERLWREQSQETDRKIKEVSTQIGRLGNRLGDFVEEMVRPAVVRLFRERGMLVNQVLRDIIAYDAQGKMQSQIDLLVINTDVVVVVECKLKLSIEYIHDHLQRLQDCKINFPQYVNYRIFGAVASMILPPEVALYAHRQGLFVLAQSGDTMKISNDNKFVPKQW